MTLKTAKKQFFLLNPKYFTTFATQSEQSVCRHIIKAFISACFGTLKPGKFHPIRNKKAVNALWDMYIPPTEHPLLDCSVWWHFIFGVGVACLFL